MYCDGMPAADDGHAAPHDKAVDAGTVMAAESVTPVVPLYAATVVPDVTPAPEIIAPTIGGVAGVAVNVNVVDEPDVEPTPEPCDVKIDALPWVTRTLIGPLPISATACAAYGSVTAVCACAYEAHSSVKSAANKYFLARIISLSPGVFDSK